MFDDDLSGSEVHSDGADRQLDAIRAGGQRLVVMVRKEVGAALDELDSGEFVKVTDQLRRAAYWAGLLAEAQQGIAIASGSKLIPAADVTPGMVLTDVGEVSDVTVEDCASVLCRRHIEIKVGDHRLNYHGDQAVYVDVEAAVDG